MKIKDKIDIAKLDLLTQMIKKIEDAHVTKTTVFTPNQLIEWFQVLKNDIVKNNI